MSSSSSTIGMSPVNLNDFTDIDPSVAAHHRKLELRLLQHSYQCKNPLCGQSEVLYKNLGSWTCRCHYGYVEGGKWSCCNKMVIENSKGCWPCDHWTTGSAPISEEFRLHVGLYGHICSLGVNMGSGKHKLSDDGKYYIIRRCKPIN
jgi:hypothetical protein